MSSELVLIASFVVRVGLARDQVNRGDASGRLNSLLGHPRTLLDGLNKE